MLDRQNPTRPLDNFSEELDKANASISSNEDLEPVDKLTQRAAAALALRISGITPEQLWGVGPDSYVDITTKYVELRDHFLNNRRPGLPGVRIIEGHSGQSLS